MELQHQSFQWIFRVDFDLVAVQGTVKSLLQHHCSKASVLQCSAFFIVQLSHPYMTTGKTIALTIWTFASKVTSLLFNILSRFVIAFLPRSKSLLILQLQSRSTVILEPKKIKSVTVSIVFPSICHEVMGLDAMIFIFWMLSFKSAFSFSSFTFIKKLFNSSWLSAIRVMSSAYLKVKVAQLCPTLCDPHGLYRPWNYPGQNTGVGRFSLLQGIFPTQRSNPGLPHCVSEVIDISPGNLDSSLCFIQPSISHVVLYMLNWISRVAIYSLSQFWASLLFPVQF